MAEIFSPSAGSLSGTGKTRGIGILAGKIPSIAMASRCHASLSLFMHTGLKAKQSTSPRIPLSQALLETRKNIGQLSETFTPP